MLWSLCLVLVILNMLHILTGDNVLQSQQDAVIPFQILGGEAQVVQVCVIIIASYMPIFFFDSLL